MIQLSFNTVVASFNRHWLEIIAVCYADHYHYLSFLDRWRSDYVTCFMFTGSKVELWQVFLGHVPYEATTVNSQTQILKVLCEVISGPCRKLYVKYIPFETGKITSVPNTAVQCSTAMISLGPGSKSHIPTGYVVFSVRTGQQQNRTYERATMVSQNVLSKFKIIISRTLEKYTYLKSS